MKHIKKLLALCLTLALVLSLAACGKQEEQPPETTPASYRIAALKGPTAMGLVKLCLLYTSLPLRHGLRHPARRRRQGQDARLRHCLLYTSRCV